MEQKQTAVEWLVAKLKSQGLLIGEPKNLVAVRQAKEMEKQQQDLLNECEIQLEYLNQKFGETGTTNALLAKLKNK